MQASSSEKPDPTYFGLGFTAAGALRYLPLDTLFDGRQYVVESKTVSLLTDLAVQDAVPPVETTPPVFLGVANPDGTLPAATREVSAIGGLFPERRLLLGDNATKQAFLASAGRAGYIHLATHASVDHTRPDLSHLLFAGAAPDERELRPREIGALKLDATKLVVLSACESGAGTNLTREAESALDSLAYEFERAGARHVLGTLWRIDDAASEELMIAFYRTLRAEPDADVAECLRHGKLLLLQGGKYSSPFYWGAYYVIAPPR